MHTGCIRISPRRNHQTNKHLDTVAARSVLEMGYSDDQVVQAIQQIMSSNPGMYLVLWAYFFIYVHAFGG